MKKSTYRSMIAAFLSVMLTFMFVACQNENANNDVGESIVLKTYGEPIDFHTADQAAYFEDYMSVSAYVDGKSEQSRPNPVTLEWTCGDYAAYTVKVSEKADMSDAATYTTSGKSVAIYNLKIATTYYWQVETSGNKSDIGTFTTSDKGVRNLYIDGVTNARDVGGHMTASGKRMVQGLLYRGGRLNVSDPDGNSYQTISKYVRQITDEGIATFTQALGIKTETDFRLTTRNGFPADMTPASPAGDGVYYLALPLNGSKAFTETASQQNIKAFFEYLAVKDNYPVYFHCNIGTDRTGLITYLIQGLCGVSEDEMKADYFFSDFGEIGEFRDPYATTVTNKTTYMDDLSDQTKYAGATLSERIRSYLYSIGISQATVDGVYSIMMGQ